MTYKFCGNLATGATLESHPWVQRMARRGLLAAVPGQKARTAKTKTTPEQAKETA